MSDFRFPSDDEHIFIPGRNGSGKTFGAMFHLSQRSYPSRPWLIVDYKGDGLIGELEGLPRVRVIDVKEKMPRSPGIYIVRPIAQDDDEHVNRLLYSAWHNERTGVYVDEGLMLGKLSAYRAILTQGRSKNVPLIVLAQRPVFLDRFTVSEASYYQVYYLHDRRDQETVNAFLPVDLGTYYGTNPPRRLPPYYSVWYDVKRDKLNILRPVPDADTILDIFESRLKPRRKVL
jgi:hypothetical protein